MQGILGILHKVFFPIMRCSFPIMSHTHTHTHTHTQQDYSDLYVGLLVVSNSVYISWQICSLLFINWYLTEYQLRQLMHFIL